ncbi:MAG: AbrB/MazE/SpoVT family DNA-binding domain-containing protein [Parvibaculum sp.]|uniref:AbrB/MazE/SpoVT family DNA-binding domain-containing protein n=1 Tax=Parvibaculum sp. TaxID=2024848 RepID=UPI00198EBBDB|nr:AbrB/MazE/SpoVT family DNA-binding domain-containing protein [Parvibaculum sp.]MBC7103992.1 AbrB/MazE/SpoVT family DNA-binding domain-containing protein [Parvibaculum sp.]MDZ4382245.1 AbrB/MazE/SpoVT family DNA-binding domain-containing protein [Parvibaculum sp.]
MGYNAKVTSKGQITLPAEMRRSLNLQEGDRITFAKGEDGRFYVEAKTDSLGALRGIVKAAKVKPGDIESWIEEARGRGAGRLGARKAARKSR